MQTSIKTWIVLVTLLISLEGALAGLCSDSDTSILNRYESAFNKIEYLLQTDGCFRSAVFTVEHTFYNDTLTENAYSNTIDVLANFVKSLALQKRQLTFNKTGDADFVTNFAIFSFIRDRIYIVSDSMFIEHPPYRYDDKDPNGKLDWSNMFVRKLLNTHKGNCHSLAFLYKMLADRLKVKCWLSLAPNHIYIRNYSHEVGWYNSELTSGVFPTDAWIAMTGYVSTDAIRNGVYMDTLSNQQSIALCLLDLAKAYAFQTGRLADNFILRCCDLALKYHPANPQALLFKAETLKKIYLRQIATNKYQAQSTYTVMEDAYTTLIKLGYREMSEKMYQRWLSNLIQHKEQFSTKAVEQSFSPRKSKP